MRSKSSLVIAITLLFASPLLLPAAVLVDTSFNSSGSYADITDNYGDSLTGSVDLTVGNNSDRMLVAILTNRGNTLPTVNTLSYGGDSFTAIPGTTASSASSFTTVNIQMFYLLAPTTTANSTLAYDFAAPASNARGIGFSVLSLSNATQSAPSLVGIDGSQPAGNATSVSINSVPTGSLLVGGTAIQGNDISISPTSGQTTYGALTPPSDNNLVNPAFGYESLASSGTAEMAWSFSGSDEFVSAAVAIAQVPEPNTTLLFVGALFGLGLVRRRQSGSGRH